MLKNYLKIAWKVLLRHRFFTFISLFGISFTLMILVVATAMIDSVAGPAAPETKLDRLLFVNSIRMTGPGGNLTSSPPSYYFLENYLLRLKTPEKIAVATTFKGVTSYVNKQRLSLDLKFTDANFWEILEFTFLEGKPFTQQDQQNANRVAVISEHARDQYFGVGVPATGKYIVADGVRYRVSGVVKNVPVSRFNSYAQIWAPVSTSPAGKEDTALNGEFMAIILAASPDDIPEIKAEYQQIVNQVKLPKPKEFNEFTSHAEGILEGMVVREMFGDGKSSGMASFIIIVSLLVFLFMLMPTINLVNINVSRIMERSSEIGVRKAFGASSQTLIGQFLVENIFLTLIGGLIAFLLSALVLYMIEDSNLIPYAKLALNLRVFGVGLSLTLLFGIISGVYPAFKMSKLRAVQALKGGSL